MGDLIEHHIFKKLGFDISNQWIIDLEPFQIFFNWIADNVTDCNILSELEILEENELKNKNSFLKQDELNKKLNLINEEYPEIFNYTNEDITKLENEIKDNKNFVKEYENLNIKMQKTASNFSREIHDIERDIHDFENKSEGLFIKCAEEAKEIQDLQKKNKKLCSELNDCFTKLHEPPLFIHQLPMDQYVLKCESFKQYLTIFLKENFKFQDYLQNDLTDEPCNITDNTFGKIKNHIIHYNKKYIQSKIEVKAIKHLTSEMDIKNIPIISVQELRRETNDLRNLNIHNSFKITYKTLMNDLNIHLEQIAQQQIETILCKNTNLKLERATQRIRKVEFLSKIVSDALLNTELVWILMQLDSEKIKNRFDNTEQLHSEAQQCLKRIEFMKQIQIQSTNELSELYCERLIKLLVKYIDIKTPTNSNKICLLEYYKFNKLYDDLRKNLTYKKNYKSILKTSNDLKRIESNLAPYLYNGPIKKPCIENFTLLKSIFELNIMKRSIENQIRQLRLDFQQNINERMKNDSLWRNGQLLWVWFLTEPKQVLIAIEEAKKSASKVPSMTGLKTYSGIRRM